MGEEESFLSCFAVTVSPLGWVGRNRLLRHHSVLHFSCSHDAESHTPTLQNCDLHLRPRNLHSHQSEQLDACGARHLLSQDSHANQSDRPLPIVVMALLGALIQVECVLRLLWLSPRIGPMMCHRHNARISLMVLLL